MEKLKRQKVIFPIILLLWGCSLVFRLQYADNMPAVNNVAHIFMLQTMKIWENESARESHFAMKHTFPNEGDKFVTYYKRYMDEKGNNYYVSHPSLSQFTLWIISGAGNFSISNHTLVWLAMLLHLMTTFLLLLLVREIRCNLPYSFSAEFITIFIYLFHPVVLYMNTFHFFAETGGQTMFVLSILVLAKTIRPGISLSLRRFALLCLVSFLLVSSEWLGLIFALILILHVIFRYRKFKNMFLPATAVLSGAFAAMLVFFIQHVTLQDAETFIRALGIRFLERSGFFGNEYTYMGFSYNNPASYSLLFKQITEVFKGSGILFLVPFLVFLFRKKFFSLFDKETNRILYITITVCAVYMIFLFSASVTHYIYMAKWVVPMTLLTALVWPFFTDKLKGHFMKQFIYFLLIIPAIWSVFIFKGKADNLNSPDEYLISYANFISEESEKDFPVFCAPMPFYQSTAEIWLSYSSGRNIRTFQNEEDICDQQYPRPKQYQYFSTDGVHFHKSTGRCNKEK